MMMTLKLYSYGSYTSLLFWSFNSLFLFNIFQLINVNAIDMSLKLYGAPRSCLCVAMVTCYFLQAIHFKEFLERTCKTKIELYSVKNMKQSGVK